jgi:hypothetical protein
VVQHMRRAEIGEGVWQRINTVCPPPEFADAEYREGLKEAVSVAVDWAFAAATGESGTPPPVPPVLLVQARVAARNRVGLAAVVRRYVVGYTVVLRGVMEEAGLEQPPSDVARRLSSLLDEVVREVSEEHEREAKRWARSADQLQVERVKELLAGVSLSIDRFAYDFDGAHVGLVASGEDVDTRIKELAEELDCRLLLVHPGPSCTWAWLGGGEQCEWRSIERWLEQHWPAEASLAMGESYRSMHGWRRTHREAQAAAPLSRRQPGRPARYGPEALRVAATNDELLGLTLRERYLMPLNTVGAQAAAIKDTLAAYLRSEWNATSVSERLGISRKTVNSRIRVAETLIGESLPTCASALDVALALDADDREAERQGK